MGKRRSKCGASSLAAKYSTENARLNFFTGGLIKPSLADSSVKNDSTVTSECLQSLIISVPDAMALQRSVLLVSSKRKLLTVDLLHLTAKPSTAHINGIVHHIHIHSQAPNIFILEVGFYEDFHFLVNLHLLFTGRQSGQLGINL